MTPKPTKSPDAVLSVTSIVGRTVTFSTAGTKPAPGSKLKSFSMDYGDGSAVPVVAGAPPPTFVYQYPDVTQDYRATLHVWDKNGLTDPDTKVVSIVVDIPIPPPNVPVDCVLSPWMLQSLSAWGACQSDGTQTRTETWTRSIVTPPANGGAACGPQIEQRTGTQACVYVPPIPPTPSTDFPALLMTLNGPSPTVAEMRARCAGPLLATTQQHVDMLCANRANGGMLDVYVSEGWPSRAGLEHYAFQIALYPIPGINYRDVTSRAQLEAVAFQLWDSLANAVNQGGDDGADVIALMCAYHWMRDALSLARRQACVTAMQAIVDEGFTISPYHHVRAKFRLLVHACGLAWVNDPDIAAVDRQDAQRRLALRSSYVDGTHGNRTATNQMAGRAGGVCDGIGYAFSEFNQGVAHIDFVYHDMWRTAMGDTTGFDADKNTALEYHPLWYAWQLAPYKEVHAGYAYYILLKTQESSDLTIDAVNGPDFSTSHVSFFANHRRFYKDKNLPMAKLADWELRQCYAPTAQLPFYYGSVSGIRFGLLTNFFGVSDVVGESPEQQGLPLRQVFPMDGIKMRTGWRFDNHDTLIVVHAPPWAWSQNGYGPVPGGSMSIHRGGPLMIQPGSGAHATIQEWSYGHNTVLFVDPNNPTPTMGGARSPNALPLAAEPPVNFTPGSVWDMGGIAISDLSDGSDAHDYDYIYADHTKSRDPAECTNFERITVWFTPKTPGIDSDRIVVMDRTETPKPLEVRWQYWPPGHPNGQRTMAITGHSSSAAGPSRAGSTDGRTTFIQPTLGTVDYPEVDGMRGKLFWTPLQPASRKIVEVWGPNAAGQFYQPDSHEYENTYGKQAENYSSSRGTIELFQGHGRYELMPQTPTLKTNLLNCLEPCEPTQATPTQAIDLSSSGLIAAQMGDRIAVASDKKGLPPVGQLTIPNIGTYRVLITGWGPNAAVPVVVTNAVIARVGGGAMVANGQGVLYLQVVTSTVGAIMAIG